MVELIKINKVYPPDIVALLDISCTVRRGEMLFLTGMSGAGKTSLLKLICAIEHPTKGVIEVDGQDLSKISASRLQRVRQRIGIAYQDFKLLPKHTVFQNIAMPMEVTYKSKKIINDRIDFLLDALNLTSKKEFRTEILSRGEQQRVSIARAAANYPPLLLADEPTGNLDPMHTKLVINLFEQLNQAGTALIIATHDESIYKDSTHQILDLDHGKMNFLGTIDQKPDAGYTGDRL
nr:ATP-binding cassette domain-containing protein [Desulfobulbaceae bacterium]